MDIDIYEIARQVMEFFHLQTQEQLSIQQKEDLSLVTRVDFEMERFCLELLAPHFSDYVLLGEETSGESCPTIQGALEHEYIITIDGIDGTWRFIEHYEKGAPNKQWLACLTCVMQRSKTNPEAYEPLLSFALRPSTDELFMFYRGESTLYRSVFSDKEKKHALSLGGSSLQPVGTLDVALDKEDCPFAISDELRNLTKGFGPSGFNMAELVTSVVHGSGPNFTIFQYKAWDFGLWPLLFNADYHFSYLSGEPFLGFEPKKFGSKAFGKINDPLVISLPQHRETILQNIAFKQT